MREAVRAALTQALEQLAVERVFSKQAIGGLYEGKKVVDKTFDNLKDQFTIKPKSSNQSSR